MSYEERKVVMHKKSIDFVKNAISQIEQISVDEAKKNIDNYIFIDVREKEEIDNIPSIENSILIPRGLLEFVADDESPLYNKRLEQDKSIIVYCAVGGRGALASKTLNEMGYKNVYNLIGGLKNWYK
tara:strand:+ start:474 stop:854 length:381 start_codon:yes stop_codon:yes gene_type:complete